jgi:hypothetical protein
METAAAKKFTYGQPIDLDREVAVIMTKAAGRIKRAIAEAFTD